MPTPALVAALLCCAAGLAAVSAAPAPQPAAAAPASAVDHPFTTTRTAVLRAVPYTAPVTGALVLRLFDLPGERWLAGHRGVDLKAEPGTGVLAPAGGVVTFVGQVVDRRIVTITHPDGLRSSLEPVDSDLTAGTAVAGGALVGTVQDVTSHCEPVQCLHWGVRRGETYLDPLALLPGGGPTVLLPVP